MDNNKHTVEGNGTSLPEYDRAKVDSLSQKAADDLIKVFAKPYMDDLFVTKHPNCRHYFEIEKERLRLLFKMKRSTELCHDALLAEMLHNPVDDKLFISLTDIQNRMLTLQGNIDETVSNISSLSRRFKIRYGFDTFRVNVRKNMASVRVKMGKLGNKGRNTFSLLRKKNKKDLVLENDKDRVAEMTEMLLWAYQPVTENAGRSENWTDIARQFQSEYGTLDEAVSAVVRQHILSDVKDCLLVGAQSIPTIKNLPANYPIVTMIRIRMAGIIAVLGGFDPSDEAVKVGVLFCLLGSEAERFFSQAVGRPSPPFTMDSISQLSDNQRSEIVTAVAARLIAKYANKNLNISKIPFMNGFVGNSLDAISTNGIANAAKALFLRNFKEQERVERMEMARMYALMNMALVDEQYDDSEKSAILSLINALNISEQGKEVLRQDVEHPVKHEVEYALFRGDVLCADSLLGSLVEIAYADSQISPEEKLYLYDVGTELGYSDAQLREKFRLG